MNPGNFSTIQKQLLFSKNSRHASLGELHIIPPTTAATVCSNLIFGLQAWGKPTWFSVSKGETAVGRLWPQCHCSSRGVPGLFMLRNTIPAPSQTYVAANPSSEMSRWKINWVINVTVPYTGVPGLLFTLIPAADSFVTANTGRTDKRQTVQFSCQSWSFTWQTFFFLPACLGHVRAARAGAAVMGQAGTLSGRAKALAPVPRQGCFR